MEFKECLEYLLQNKFIVILANKPVVTVEFENKVKEALNSEQLVTKKVDISKPKEFTNDEKKKIWNEFIEAAEIPHRVKTTTGTYTVRQYSISAANKLIKILQEQGKDTSFVQATKEYYKSVSYPILLSRYLNDDYWVHEVEQYKKNKHKPQITEGTNKFED